MPSEKQQYVETVGISRNTYKRLYSTQRRIEAIAHTFARVLIGRQCLDKNLKRREIDNLTQYITEHLILPIINSPQPWQDEAEYSRWHKEAIEQVIANCPMTWNDGNCLTIGMAQKIVNLFIKDLWALEILSMRYESFLHVVLDRIVLKEMGYRTAWTQIDDYQQYKVYQTKFKEHVEKQNIDHGQCLSPIEFENIVWLKK